MNEFDKNLSLYAEREISLLSPNLLEQLKAGVEANGILLLCSDGASGGRSSYLSTAIRKEKNLPAFYLFKGLKGLAHLETDKLRKVIELMLQFKVVAILPSAEEVARFTDQEFASYFELLAAAKGTPVLITEEHGAPPPRLTAILAAYAKAIKKA
jgi:hypothetical protein